MNTEKKTNDKNVARVPQFKLPAWLLPHAVEVRAWGPVEGSDTHCWVEGCARSPYLHGLCRVHYFRAVRYWKRPKAQSAAVGPAGDSESTNHNDA